jgi:hypothetical protein
MTALVERLVQCFEERLEGPSEGLLERFVAASLSEPGPADEAISASLVADVAHAPALLDLLRRRCAEWDPALEASTGDRTLELLVRLALDGLRYDESLSLAPPSKAVRKRLAERLLAVSGHGQRPVEPEARGPRRRRR